jgi:hypothetical protein
MKFKVGDEVTINDCPKLYFLDNYKRHWGMYGKVFTIKEIDNGWVFFTGGYQSHISDIRHLTKLERALK